MSSPRLKVPWANRLKTPPRTEADKPLISAHPLWRSLQQRASKMPALRELFDRKSESGVQRFEQMSVRTDGLLLDYSKQHIDQAALTELLQLAQLCAVEQKRDAMFLGRPVNVTEQRPALHTALRAPAQAAIQVQGENVVPAVQSVLQRMADLCTQIHSEQWQGFRARAIRHVVNIGIGGSDLGPRMAVQALQPYAQSALQFHFVSNVDGWHLADVLRQVEADQTLFIIASKTFTTQETMMNAHSARAWMLAQGCPEAELHKHFVAASTNVTAAQVFGIAAENVFPFWDWVGGRYSLWSAIGLSLMLSIGPENFRQFLAGAHAMDRHFGSAPLERNLPVLFALMGIWNTNFLARHAQSIAPYDQRLAGFPAYLQQLEMESNGKRVSIEGRTLDYATCPVLFGEPGTNGQHAYFQLLHQGPQVIPVDFIAVAQDDSGVNGHHPTLMANCLAQSQAFAFGKTIEEVLAEMPPERAALAPHRTFTGNRPSNTLVLDKLDPAGLGALIALYEHKVFVQAAIWDINPFDQWGVELGKTLAAELGQQFSGAGDESYSHTHDASTVGLFKHLQALRK
ncbi:MAG: glucose-6-phosphate isomerase [Burkholderiaceae bacterium]|nr:MAG: glucose-6-phosphate isomerase [Burkholderiaceae bacterium]